MESTGNNLNDLLNSLDTSQLASTLGVMSLSDNSKCIKNKEDTVREITGKVQDSYWTSIRNLTETLVTKVRFIQSLKW